MQIKLMLTVALFSYYADAWSSTIQVCFTPGGNCTQQIVDTIDSAKEDIFAQAYSFTSVPIAKALIAAQDRGVAVKVIVDKSQSRKNKASVVPYLQAGGIPVWTDYKVTIAHNKVMIIDHEKVVTGSFNFTRSAQEHNAENLLIIDDLELAKKYKINWDSRLIRSKQEGDTNGKI